MLETAFRLALWVIENLLLDSLKAKAPYLVSKTFSRRVVKQWNKRLERHFAGEFTVLRSVCAPPRLTYAGDYQPPNDLTASIESQRKTLAEQGYPNEHHALLNRRPNWAADPVHLTIDVTDFATVCALRAAGQKPPIVSAGGVVVCPEARKLLLHRRAQASHTYGDCLHVLGGAHIPSSARSTYDDRGRIWHTVWRELFEETGLTNVDELDAHLVASREESTGFIQFVYLGLQVPQRALDAIKENWEGLVEEVGFDELPELFQTETFVPSGKALVLAWLAVGAPNAGRRPRFAGQTPQALFNAEVTR